MRTWMKFVPAVLLLVPMASASAAAPETPAAAPTIDKLRSEIEALRRDVIKLQADVLRNGLRGASMAEEMREIRGLLARLDRMTTERAATTRFYGPPTGTMPPAAAPAPALPPATATVTIRNQYTANATVRINGRPYPVLAGQELRVPGVPVGPLNYDVDVEGFGIVQGLRTETLRPAGRIINIFPRF